MLTKDERKAILHKVLWWKHITWSDGLDLLHDLDAKDAEISRITTLNTQQTRRMIHLTVLAVGCSTHPRYRAKRQTACCKTCNLMWEASQALKEMATANQIVAGVVKVLESQDVDKQFKELDEFFAGFAAGPDEEDEETPDKTQYGW